MTLLYRHLAWTALLAAVVATAGLVLPVVTAAFFGHVPPRAMLADIALAALVGIGPTTLYIALPLTVGMGVTLRYAQFASDGYLAVLHASRLSAAAIAAPAVAVAAGAVVIGYVLSCWIAPLTVRSVHDTIWKIGHSLDHRLLPTHRFERLADGRYDVYLGDPLGDGRYRDVIVRERAEDGSEKTVMAPMGRFDETGGRRIITLFGGVLQERAEIGADLRMVAFVQLVQPLGLGGSSAMPPRDWRGVFEETGVDFLVKAPAALANPDAHRPWWSEATKRFVIPLLALGHVVLGLGLVLYRMGAAMRNRSLGYAYAAIILAVHVGVLILGETVVRFDPRLAGLALVAALAEIAIGLRLIHLADNPRRRAAFIPRIARVGSRAS